jgi:hypothetical protein
MFYFSEDVSQWNVLAMWLLFVLNIVEDPSSNHGPKTDYPDWDISLFSSVFPGKCQDSTLNYASATLFHFISFVIIH